MKFVILFLAVIALVSWSLFGLIIWAVPAKIDGQLIVINFFYVAATGLVGLTLTITLVFYLISSFFQPKRRVEDTGQSGKKIFWLSLRRGLLISILTVGLTTLNVFELLNILNISLLVGILILTEIYFSSR